MKITIDIDCTPEEARRFMGLPDVGPMQEAMLKELQDLMMANVTSMQPAELIKTWLPMSIDSWSKMQKAYWTQLMSSGTPSDDES